MGDPESGSKDISAFFKKDVKKDDVLYKSTVRHRLVPLDAARRLGLGFDPSFDLPRF